MIVNSFLWGERIQWPLEVHWNDAMGWSQLHNQQENLLVRQSASLTAQKHVSQCDNHRLLIELPRLRISFLMPHAARQSHKLSTANYAASSADTNFTLSRSPSPSNLHKNLMLSHAKRLLSSLKWVTSVWHAPLSRLSLLRLGRQFSFLISRGQMRSVPLLSQIR